MVNIFVVVDCKERKNIFITKSARKAKEKFYRGTKIEVWDDNGIHIETIYLKTFERIYDYIKLQKQYIGEKQAKAEQRNKNAKAKVKTY